jgi:PHD/YefM family antitoxin component YafN of YafNO toxin-antitoxin module
MQVLSTSNVKDRLDVILAEVQNSYEPLFIAGEKYSAVLISEEVWRSIEETLYLMSIPGMKDSIVSGMNEKIEDCASTVEW